MVHLNARFLAINAGLLTAVLSTACGTAPTGPSAVSDAVAPSAQTSTASTLATTQGVAFRPAPIACFVPKRLLLETSNVDKVSVRVTSNYVITSEKCARLTWTLSTKHASVPSIDKLGREIITVYSNMQPTGLPSATTVTALGPDGLTASIEFVLP
jgi:hypothetical protein